MTCAACTRAETTPRINDFTVACESCKARALAAIGAHEESRDTGRMTAQYRDALGALFGDAWQAGNAAVKAWAAMMDKPAELSEPIDKPRARRPARRVAA